jgi:hypothetical protein
MRLTVVVGAAVDASLANVLRSAQASVEKLQQQTQASARAGVAASRDEGVSRRAQAKATSNTIKGLSKDEAKAAKDAEREKAKAAKDGAKTAAKAEKERMDAQRAAMRQAWADEDALAAKGTMGTKKLLQIERELAKEQKQRARENKAAFNANAREVERQMARQDAKSNRDRRAFAGAVGAGVAGGLSLAHRGASAALGVVGEVAAGMGVNTSIGAGVAQGVAMQSRAVDISNSAYMPGQAGPAGQRVDPRILEEEARALGDFARIDPSQALEGLQAFVAKTGDLDTGRQVLKDMAMLAKATGANLNDVVDAAGDVSSNLGDIPDKGKAVQAVMATIAGQGKLGAVEMRDLARQMAKLAANAPKIVGDVGENIAVLGMLAQSARAHGGASSATMAATSAAAFMNTIATPARAAAFKEATGKSFYTKGGQVRDPREIIIDALRAKGTDVTGWKKIFANVAGERAVGGFRNIYASAINEAKAKPETRHLSADAYKDLGEAAVRAEMAKQMNATMKRKEIEESFAASLQTSESKVQAFNNTMNRTSVELQANLMPALQSLAPVMVKLATAGAGMVGWMFGTDHSRELESSGDLRVGALTRGRDVRDAARGALLGNYERDAKGNLVKQGPQEVSARSIEIDEHDIAAMEKQETELAKKVAAGRGRKKVSGLGTAGDAVVGWATNETDAERTRQSQREHELEMLRETLQTQKDSMAAVKEGLFNGSLKLAPGQDPIPVKIMNATPPGSAVDESAGGPAEDAHG